MTVPLVTVVITTYQQRRWAGEAVRSALRQTHPAVEVLVVDDGSTDGTAQELATVPGVSVIAQANAGVCAARNAGAVAAKGEVLCFLDGDDRLLPDGIETGLRHLTAGTDFVFGRCRLVDAAGVPLRTARRAPVTGDLYEALLRETWVAPPGVMLVRRVALDRAGGWDTMLTSGGDDYDLYLRLARDHVGVDHDGVVCDYRVHPNNRSTDYERCLADNLIVLAAQSVHTASRPHLEAARLAGVRHYRRMYGAKIALSGARPPWHNPRDAGTGFARAAAFAAREPGAVLRLLRANLRRRRAAS